MSSRSSDVTSLADADWLSWPETDRLFSALSAKGDGIRAVGGAIRDSLLDREVREVDFATTALPEQVIQLAEEAGLKAVPTGLDHGTVTIVVGDRSFEVTTLREDVATDGRRATIAYTDDWAEDASRRDFTINALYADADGKVHDPLGALDDINDLNIRFIGEPVERVREDYLRILRFFRFHAELAVDDYDAEGLAACVRERAGLDALSAERVSSELLRLLAAPGALQAVRKMFSFGLLVQVLRAVPLMVRLERAIEIEEASGASADPLLRLAALILLKTEDAAHLSDLLKLSRSERKRLEKATSYKAAKLTDAEFLVERLLYKMNRQGARDCALLAWVAEGAPSGSSSWSEFLGRIEKEEIPELPIKGADLVEIGVEEGPEVGRLVSLLEQRWIESGFSQDRASLLALGRELSQSGN